MSLKTLRNGAVVINEHLNADTKVRTVLAIWLEPNRYVTWRVNEQGDAYLGHYHNTLESAVADFMHRTR